MAEKFWSLPSWRKAVSGQCKALGHTIHWQKSEHIRRDLPWATVSYWQQLGVCQDCGKTVLITVFAENNKAPLAIGGAYILDCNKSVARIWDRPLSGWPLAVRR